MLLGAVHAPRSVIGAVYYALDVAQIEGADVERLLACIPCPRILLRLRLLLLRLLQVLLLLLLHLLSLQ